MPVKTRSVALQLQAQNPSILPSASTTLDLSADESDELPEFKTHSVYAKSSEAQALAKQYCKDEGLTLQEMVNILKHARADMDDLVSAQGVCEFRGVSIPKLLLQYNRLQWTAEDHQKMSQFSHRNSIAPNIKPKDLPDLVKSLGFTGHNKRVDEELASKTCNALKYHLEKRMRFALRIEFVKEGGRVRSIWPTWIPSDWDGNMDTLRNPDDVDTVHANRAQSAEPRQQSHPVLMADPATNVTSKISAVNTKHPEVVPMGTFRLQSNPSSNPVLTASLSAGSAMRNRDMPVVSVEPADLVMHDLSDGASAGASKTVSQPDLQSLATSRMTYSPSPLSMAYNWEQPKQMFPGLNAFYKTGDNYGFESRITRASSLLADAYGWEPPKQTDAPNTDGQVINIEEIGGRESSMALAIDEGLLIPVGQHAAYLVAQAITYKDAANKTFEGSVTVPLLRLAAKHVSITNSTKMKKLELLGGFKRHIAAYSPVLPVPKDEQEARIIIAQTAIMKKDEDSRILLDGLTLKFLTEVGKGLELDTAGAKHKPDLISALISKLKGRELGKVPNLAAVEKNNEERVRSSSV